MEIIFRATYPTRGVHCTVGAMFTSPFGSRGYRKLRRKVLFNIRMMHNTDYVYRVSVFFRTSLMHISIWNETKSDTLGLNVLC